MSERNSVAGLRPGEGQGTDLALLEADHFSSRTGIEGGESHRVPVIVRNLSSVDNGVGSLVVGGRVRRGHVGAAVTSTGATELGRSRAFRRLRKGWRGCQDPRDRNARSGEET